jgi:4-amino-4-deoxy-L-arabinose transferase-like glycosyltransferase
LPWYILVQNANPHFIHTFIFEHNLARFSTDRYHHEQAFWYYLPVLLLALIPWTFFAIPALIDALRSCWNDWRASHRERKTGVEAVRKNPDAFPEFLVLWTILPIIFFSLSKSKLPGYILPAIPPCTILTADYLQRKGKEAASPLIVGAHAVLAGVFVATFLMFPTYFLENERLATNARIAIIAVATAVATLVFLAVRRAGTRYLRYATLFPVVLVIGFIVKAAAPTIDEHYSARPIARELDTLGMGGRTIAVYEVKRDIRYGLGFYRNEKVFSYNEEPVPISEHLLVAKAGDKTELLKLLEGRHLRHLGHSSAQKLDYYLVASKVDPDF